MHHPRTSRLLCAGLLTAVTCGSVVSSAGMASADIASQIRDEQVQLDRLNMQAEAAAERFNAGRIALVESQQRAALAQARLRAQDIQVASLRSQAGAFAARVYMQGPAGQAVAIMGGTTPEQVLGQLSVFNNISRDQAQVLSLLATARHRQAQATADASQALATAKATVTKLEADKQAVESSATQAQQVLKQLQAKQVQLIQAAKDAAAKRAAQARAAALAAQVQQAQAALVAFRSQPVAVEAPPAAPASVVHDSGSAAQVAVQVAMSELGKSYVWGASGPDAFDCSGLTMYAYAAAGISLPHFAAAQFNQGRHVSQGELQPGDLVFFGSDLGHMGMYVGNGQFLHAPHTGDVVKISPLSGYYQQQYAGAVRIAG